MAIIQSDPVLSPKEAVKISYEHGTLDTIDTAKAIADEWGGQDTKAECLITTVCLPLFMLPDICTANRRKERKSENVKELHEHEL